MKKNIKIGIAVGVLIIITSLIVLNRNYFKYNTETDGILNKATAEEILNVEVNSSTWRVFPYKDYNYSFYVPKEWIIVTARSVEEQDVSKILGKGEKKRTIALSRGEDYFMYVFPEGGYGKSDLKTYKRPIEIKEITVQDRKALLEKYDEENIVLRFKDYHDFRIQLFVSKDHLEGWAILEKMLALMDVKDKIIPSSTRSNSPTPIATSTLIK